MPTVDELLNASNEVTTCTVNPDTREIIVPEKYKVLGVFSDEKVTKIPFTCPRVVGNNVDLTEYNLYINYENAIGKSNAYLIEDVVVSGDNITFSWLLSRNVTLSPGVVKYSLCAKKLNGDTISNEWNTTIATGLVIQGLEATREIIEENPDIIEALISKAHTHANKAILDKFAETNGKPTYGGEALCGGGAGDFIINMTLESDDYIYFTVTSCDATFEQVEAAVADEKSVILVASFDGNFYELPMIQYTQGSAYCFGTFFMGMVIYSTLYKTENASPWLFAMTKIGAYAVDYSNDALPNVTDVEAALDELVPNSHIHANKDTLDKLSVTGGKLQYNGSDVGLKGDKGDTPVKGTDYWTAADKAEIVEELKPSQVTSGTSITLADNTEYRLTDVTTLSLTYPEGYFECWMRLTFSASGTITVTLPATTQYIGTTPTFANGETWEMSIKDGIVIAGKVA